MYIATALGIESDKEQHLIKEETKFSDNSLLAKLLPK
jgi:hypothetical protein